MSFLLKLLGIKGEADYESLKKLTKKVNDRLSIAFKLQEINEVNEILDHHLNAIPAIIINDEILFELAQHLPSEDELFGIVYNSIEKHTLSKDSKISFLPK